MIKFLRSLNRQFINQIHTIEFSQPGENTNISWSRFMRYQPVSLLCIVSTRLQSLPRYQFPMSVNRKSFLSINPDRTPLFAHGERKTFRLLLPRNFFFSLLVNKKSACSKNRNGSLLHKEKKKVPLVLFLASKKFNRKLAWILFFLYFSASIVSSPPIDLILFGAQSKNVFEIASLKFLLHYNRSVRRKCYQIHYSYFFTNDRPWLGTRANYFSPISVLRCMYLSPVVYFENFLINAFLSYHLTLFDCNISANDKLANYNKQHFLYLSCRAT